MNYFYSSIIALIFSGCHSYYKNLRPTTADPQCINAIRPQGLTTSWFNASIDVVGKHISGLLLIKKMENETTRIVFTNEMGIAFFDFEFSYDGNFTVKKIIHQLDKKPVIEILRKDFFLLLAFPFQEKLRAWQNGNELYLGVVKGSEKWYFTTTHDCSSLATLELGSDRKQKVRIILEGDSKSPQNILITHLTFQMTIKLKKISKDAD